MDDVYDLVLSMFAVVVTALVLVAGEVYLVTRPHEQDVQMRPATIATSQIK
jgi:hypothetical protein